MEVSYFSEVPLERAAGTNLYRKTEHIEVVAHKLTGIF